MFRVVAEGPGGTRSGVIEVTPFVIGSAPGCDLALVDPSIGSRHAQLEVQPDGRIVLRDLGWAAGTFLGSSRVEAAWLDLPGTFRIGATQLRVTSEPDRPAAPPPAPPAPPATSPERQAEPSGPDVVSRAAPPAAEDPAPLATPPAALAAPPSAAVGVPLPEAAGPPQRRDAVVSTPMPDPLRRGLWLLVAAGIIEVIGGAIVVAVLLAGDLELSAGDSTLLWVTATIGLAAGVAEIALVRFAWHRSARAMQLLLLLAVALAVLATWDVITVLSVDDGNIAIPALRLGANLGGAIALFRFRSWYAS